MVSPKRKVERRGFTLMELMIVLAVMGVMMGMIGFSLSGGGGAALQASQRQLLGLVQQTRAKAALYGRPARLIVSNDEQDEEKFYRCLEIVVQDANETNQWVVQGEEKYLEDGVYLLPYDDSKVATPDDWSDLAYSVWSHDEQGSMKLKDSFKGVRTEGGGQAFSYLEFNAEGNLVCPHEGDSSTPSYPMLVLANGSPSPGSDKLLRFDDVNSVSGILLRRFGGFAVLDSRDFGIGGRGGSSGSGGY
ncbi:MAG: prepilin-type N-terminal cleavage/methylation domain-containing protein [Verrucomicrobiota bacterium]|nr:prepilin-type N-terminal cleavage/methylation domain-containing protein [Verrucomicrobiota bacterium]